MSCLCKYQFRKARKPPHGECANGEVEDEICPGYEVCNAPNKEVVDS